MRFSVGMAGTDAADELRDLREWVENDPELRAHVTMSYAVAEPGSEDMGPTLELVEFAVSSGISLASLIVSIAAWRDSRRSQPTVEFYRGGRQPQTLTMTASDEMTVKEITVRLSDGAGTGSSEA
jgi:hypothetical protein